MRESFNQCLPFPFVSAVASPTAVHLTTLGVQTVPIPSVYGIRFYVLYLHGVEYRVYYTSVVRPVHPPYRCVRDTSIRI